MSKLKVGDRIRDNANGRILRILDSRMAYNGYWARREGYYISRGSTVARDFPRTLIRAALIHTDGEPRRSGYDLVRSTDPTDPHSGTLALDGTR